eukprot:scaffold350_cov100-Pinguiococcus_pyrenoidosus.AAC.1
MRGNRSQSRGDHFDSGSAPIFPSLLSFFVSVRSVFCRCSESGGAFIHDRQAFMNSTSAPRLRMQNGVIVQPGKSPDFHLLDDAHACGCFLAMMEQSANHS